MAEVTPEELDNMVGKEAGLSRWFTITQDRITAFAELTEDRQFIHLDPERARSEAGFEGTVAHGFLTLSMLSSMYYDALPDIAGAANSVNYGFDRLRFVSPVPAGAKVRARFILAEVDRSIPGRATLRHDVTVEIAGQVKPALVARWINIEFLEAE